MKRTLLLATAVAAALTVVLGSQATASGLRSAGSLSRHEPSGAAVVVDDVTVQVHGQAVPMYVVAPANRGKGHGGEGPRHARAGILFLHLFEPGTVGADRTEYLAEAVRLARRGTVSFLPQGSFPWQADPVGTPADAAAIRSQLAVFRSLLHRLAARADVDPERLAVVGHDYGAMYAALLSHDPLPHSSVLETPDATWENWFLKFWLGFEGEQAAQYAATFAGLQPAEAVRGRDDHLFLQFADDDFFIPAEVRNVWAASVPRAKIGLYHAEHELNTTAETEREAWLSDELRLGH
jgi:hypothetical protein